MGGGGAERQLTYLAAALGEAGHDVHVALALGGPNLVRLEATGATLHWLERPRHRDPRIVLALRRMINAVNPDVVQCWIPQMHIAAGLAARWTGRPWILSERSSAVAYPATLKNRVRVAIARSAAAVVANSPSGLRYWEPRLPPGAVRAVIRNALPLAEIGAARAAPPEAAGLEPGAALVLMAGRLERVKNPHIFIDAIERLQSQPGLRALMCGDGPLSTEINAAIAAKGLRARVQTRGYAADLWPLMKRASVLVSTSVLEGSPNVVLEAMASGCPLVVSDIDAHRELLDDSCAILVSPHDGAGFARAIRTVLQNPEAARQRASVAAARVRTFAPVACAGAYIEVYAAVARRRH